MMKLSENSDYLEYMRAYANGNYEAACLALNKCLNNPNAEVYDKAFFLQCLGEISFREKNERQSIEYFQLAETVDSESLLPQYMFAKFLAHKLERYMDAIRKCDDILQAVTKSPHPKVDEDFDSDYYTAKANELKAFCEERLIVTRQESHKMGRA